MRRIALLALVVLACDGSSSPNPGPGGPSDGSAPSGWRAAVGGGGLVLQTYDDQTWSARTVAPVDLYGVTCVSTLVGWAVGANGTIAHTTDGGSTWSMQDSHLSASLRAVRFADAQHGVVVGDGGALAFTSDGATWTPVSASSDDLTSVAATSAGVFYVTTAGGSLLRSTDWGATYTTTLTMGSTVVSALTAAAATTTLVIVGDMLGHLWTSADGETFTVEGTMMAPVTSISLAGEWGQSGSWSSITALAVGEQGLIESRDAYGSWKPMASGTSANLHAVLVTGTYGYAAGDDGTLLRFDGSTWTGVTTQTTAALWSLDDL